MLFEVSPIVNIKCTPMHPKSNVSQDSSTCVDIYKSGEAAFLLIFIRELNTSAAANAHPLLHGVG